MEEKSSSKNERNIFYQRVVRPTMSFGFETMTLTKRQEFELEVAELKM